MRTVLPAGAKPVLAALLLVLTSSAVAVARTPDFTVEQLLSSPFPYDLIAAPKGGLVAWVYEDHGARNIWVSEAGGGKARKITNYSGDDGTDLGELTWDGDGKTVFFSRGGSLEGGGPVNIMTSPAGAPPQVIWAVSVDGGEPKRIGEGHTATVSPKGDIVAFINNNQVWTAPITGAQPATQLIKDRGRNAQLSWSPDGSKLAFVSGRTDHSFIGVYDVAAKSITWLAPSVDQDRSPSWSADGTKLAFLRIPTGEAFRFGARRESTPWAIVVADAATGAGKPVFTAKRGRGSVFYDTIARKGVFWVGNDQLVFPWEETGWLNLYVMPAAGGTPRVLTPGAHEVFNLSLSPDQSKIVYSSNLNDTDRLHLWEVPVAGGAPKQLTSGTAIDDYPVQTSDGKIVALHGDGQNPLRPVLIDGGAATDLATGVIPSDFPLSKLVQPQGVVFTASDGVQVHGQLFVPANKAASTKGPAVLFFHGGPSREMFLGWHPMDAYSHMYAMNQWLAANGYVVLSVNYRSGIGYGMEFREALNKGPSGASEHKDLIAAVNFLRARSDIDPKRIGSWGISYGGIMTAMGLSRNSDLLAAGVDGAGVHNWKSTLPHLTAPGADPAQAKIAYEASAIATTEKWKSPVLFIHGDDDRNVAFAQTPEMIAALRKRAPSVEIEQIIIPNEIHNYLRFNSWVVFTKAMGEFFDRKLANK
ncbi:prolyl oligopeptidase family serine peptidase [Roseiterribacter gracilis]|uniref:Acyl-peptide hydrolase n=1 Tax=Roseiterribacter gracilis TaxID=2812848 RepID=A0A8S8XDX9_9PROT|nr:peptidase S9 [Rhodospirillales bacterium TMPK1]